MQGVEHKSWAPPPKFLFATREVQGSKFLANTVILMPVIGRPHLEKSWCGEKGPHCPFVAYFCLYPRSCLSTSHTDTGDSWCLGAHEVPCIQFNKHVSGLSCAWRNVIGTRNTPEYKTWFHIPGAWTPLLFT